jgi:hypothetical protein
MRPVAQIADIEKGPQMRNLVKLFSAALVALTAAFGVASFAGSPAAPLDAATGDGRICVIQGPAQVAVGQAALFGASRTTSRTSPRVTGSASRLAVLRTLR